MDTGAFFTLVSAKLLRELGVERFDSYSAELADGRLVDYDAGYALATVDGRTVTTLVLFGNDDVEPLLGAYTLEGLQLAVDPVNARLIPLKLRMVSHPSA